MYFGILHRMIFWELLRVFLFSLIGITGLFLVGGVIQQASMLSLSGDQVFRVIPLLIPFSLPYTIPATALFAACVSYGRLAQENEAVAIKATGVDLLTVLKPALLLGVIAAGSTAFISYELIPRTQRELQLELLKDPEETLYGVLRRERVFRSANFPYVLYVREVQDRRLLDVVVKRRADKASVAAGEPIYDFVARTREAKMVVDLNANTLTIDNQNDKWAIKSPTGEGESQDNKPIVIPLPNDYRQDKLMEMAKARPQTIDWDNLPASAAGFLRDSEEALFKRNALMAVPPDKVLTQKEREEYAAQGGVDPSVISYDPNERTKQIAHYQEVNKFLLRLHRTMLSEYNMRPALAIAGLLFALIGCPVGMYANRADYLSTFVICFVPAMTIYFPLLLSGSGMARDGKVSMIVGIWSANALFAVGVFVLSWRLIRR
jgi:lipopolysaccharide export system permease protein